MFRAKTVDEYLDKHSEWSQILQPLCALLRATDMQETVKWGAPVFTHSGRNVVGMGAFKSYAGLWFFDGALLDDPERVLVNAQEGKTLGMRQWRFQQPETINKKLVQAYVGQAINNAMAGKFVKPKVKKALEIPQVLAEVLAADEALSAAFAAFTPGKQREFAEYIAEAKRVVTIEKRIAKITPMIALGEGLNDRYC